MALPAPVLMPQVQVTRVALAPTVPVDDGARVSMAGGGGVAAEISASQFPTATAAADGGTATPGAADGAVSETATPVAAAAPELPAPDGTALEQAHNILLLGTDQSDLSYVGRTDSIMILTVDAANGRAALISLPRDLYLPIPGVGYGRINTAYAYGEVRKPGGGIPLLISTVERNLGVRIDNYMRIDFSGFREVVDALGGVDITVKCPIYDEKNPDFFDVYTLEPGDYHMDGRQALYYSRSRKSTSDFDRARRQQQVLMAIRQRVMEGDLLGRAPALWAALRETVDTDLGAGDFLEFARLGATIDSQHLFALVIRPPLVEGWTTPQGAQVQIPDLPAIIAAVDQVWDRPPMAQQEKDEPTCPSAP